ncbi:MAG TPA: LPD29 domain-containing protein [Zeimonas sp.]
MNDWKAKQAAQAAVVQALYAANPQLVQIGGKVDALQAAAKNIRIELAAAFPGVKFSVKSSRFSMGDSIDVRWTDGPIAAQVEEIVGKYQAGSFDGMTDLYTYERNAWRDAFGDAKYVQTAREDSDRAIASAIRTVFARYPGNFRDIARPGIEQYRSGDLRSVQVPGFNNDLQSLVRREAYRRTWSVSKAPVALAAELQGEAA